MKIYHDTTRCRLCTGSTLIEAIDLGRHYLASTFVRSNENHPLSQTKVPLTLVLCTNCGLLQLRETVDRNLLFRDYYYRSATNPMMLAALKDVAEAVSRNADLRKGDYILDVGCNDCTMLSFFSDDYKRIGVEPATNIDWSGVDETIHIINDYFSKNMALSATNGSSFKAVTSIAMLYSVLDLHSFASEVKSILSENGVWCIQVSYLPYMIKNLSFYDICHEHLYYFSLKTLRELLQRNGLDIFDATTNPVNGGSLRVFATHTENLRQKTDAFSELMNWEIAQGVHEIDTYQEFFHEICKLKEKTRNYIREEIQKGGLVIGLGASTKGNVLLQFFEIDREELPYISERNPDKVSLRTLGTDIELISEKKARELKPSSMLVLIWFFKKEILKRERAYIQNGGKLLFPMPYFHIVSKDGVTSL